MAEDEEQWQHVRSEPAECPSVELGAMARKVGMSCQKLFERSYLSIGQTDSFARAVFARYLASVNGGRVIPAIVKKYCDSMPTQGKDCFFRRGFCSGCMLNTQGVAGLAFAYSLIHPQSQTEDLQTIPESVLVNPAIEKLYDSLLVSGALDKVDDEYQDPSAQWINEE